MDSFLATLPWIIVAALYVEHGWTWLRLVMVTDTSPRSANLLTDLSGKNGGSAAAAAKVVGLTLIIGWPVWILLGWINARRGHA